MQRPVPLVDSIPERLPRNPNSPLICGIGRSLGRHIKPISVYRVYEEYKKQIFPKPLESPNVLPEDKHKIREPLLSFTQCFSS